MDALHCHDPAVAAQLNQCSCLTRSSLPRNKKEAQTVLCLVQAKPVLETGLFTCTMLRDCIRRRDIKLHARLPWLPAVDIRRRIAGPPCGCSGKHLWISTLSFIVLGSVPHLLKAFYCSLPDARRLRETHGRVYSTGPCHRPLFAQGSIWTSGQLTNSPLNLYHRTLPHHATSSTLCCADIGHWEDTVNYSGCQLLTVRRLLIFTTVPYFCRFSWQRWSGAEQIHFWFPITRRSDQGFEKQQQKLSLLQCSTGY